MPESHRMMPGFVKNTHPIPVILVGCGAVSRFFYAKALGALAGAGSVRVVTLVDPSEENLAALSDIFPGAKKAGALEEAGVGKSHLVIIASPPRFHAEQTIYALENGASVLCEKPMASTVAEAEAMLKAAEENDGLLAVGLYRRFFPAAEAIKGILQNGPLGKLQSFSIREGTFHRWQPVSDSFFNKSSTSGGVFFDIGAHVLDLLLWWLGEPADFKYEDDAMGGLEANCRLELFYPGGCRGEVRLSKDWANENHHTFNFERGVVRWEVGAANGLKIKLDGMSNLLSGKLEEVLQCSEGLREVNPARTDPQSFIEQLSNVTAAMRGEEDLRVPGEEGLRSLQLIEHCYARRRLMEQPWLTPAEAEEAARLAGLGEGEWS